MRRRREQEQVLGRVAEQLAQAVALGVLGLVAEVGGAHLVGLVAHHEVPGGRPELLLYLVVAGKLIQAADAEVHLVEGVARGRRLEHLVGEDGELQPELAPQLVLPLLHEVAWRHDEAALEVAAGHHLLDEEARHDRLSRAGVVREHVAQRQARQHILINGLDLVGQGLDGRGAYGQVGVE